MDKKYFNLPPSSALQPLIDKWRKKAEEDERVITNYRDGRADAFTECADDLEKLLNELQIKIRSKSE